MITTTRLDGGYVSGSEPLLIRQVFEVAGTTSYQEALAAARHALDPDLAGLPQAIYNVRTPVSGTWTIELRLTAREP